jgi:hypothetical protein
MPNKLPSEAEVLKTAFGPGKQCPPLDQLVALADAAAPAALAQHVKSCTYCQTELHLFRTFQAGDKAQDEKNVRKVTEQLRTRQLQEIVRDRAAAPHLAEAPVPWWRAAFAVRSLAPASLAMAAVLLIVAAVIYFRQSSQPALQATNRGGQEVFRSSGFAVLSPAGDLQKQPGEIRWEPVQQAIKYQVRLLEVDRTELWKTETSGDHIELPAVVRVRIVPAKTLFCEITAFDASGNKIGETGLVRFRLLQNNGQ